MWEKKRELGFDLRRRWLALKVVGLRRRLREERGVERGIGGCRCCPGTALASVLKYEEEGTVLCDATGRERDAGRDGAGLGMKSELEDEGCKEQNEGWSEGLHIG